MTPKCSQLFQLFSTKEEKHHICTNIFIRQPNNYEGKIGMVEIFSFCVILNVESPHNLQELLAFLYSPHQKHSIIVSLKMMVSEKNGMCKVAFCSSIYENVIKEALASRKYNKFFSSLRYFKVGITCKQFVWFFKTSDFLLHCFQCATMEWLLNP